MNNRKIFADTINEIGSHTDLSANECERFGMTWGCKENCPVFQRGECEQQEENQAIFGRVNDEPIEGRVSEERIN